MAEETVVPPSTTEEEKKEDAEPEMKATSEEPKSSEETEASPASAEEKKEESQAAEPEKEATPAAEPEKEATPAAEGVETEEKEADSAPAEEQPSEEVPDAPEPPAYLAATTHPTNPLQGVQEMPMGDGSAAPPSRVFFADFLPRSIQPGNQKTKLHPKFEDFEGLFAQVNQWVQENPKLKVISVEQLSRQVGWDGSPTPDDTIFTTKDMQGGNWIRGIRIWLAPRDDGDESPPDSLAFRNYMPVSGAITDIDQLLDLQTTIDIINSKLDSEPIPGKIVAVQTVDQVLDSEWKIMHLVNPNSGNDSYYMYEDGTRILTFVRIIYAQGPPLNEKIGVADFPPAVVKVPSSGKGRTFFQPFGEILTAATEWANASDGKTVSVRNIDIEHAKFNNITSKMAEQIKKSATVDTGMMWHQNSRHFDPSFLKFVRICYVKLGGPVETPPQPISAKTFVTHKVAYSDGESMHKVVGRGNAWLSLTGNSVRLAQSAVFEYKPMDSAVDLQECCITHEKKMKYYMRVLVLFLNNTYEEPQAKLLPKVNVKWRVKQFDGSLKTDQKPKSSTCILL